MKILLIFLSGRSIMTYGVRCHTTRTIGADMGRPVKTAQEAADNWAAAMAGATTAYTKGVQAVTESPTAKAAKNLAKYQMNTAKAVASGRMAAALNAVTLSDWQQRAVQKGANNLASGAAASKGKFLAKAQSKQATWQQQRDAVESMPSGGTANAMARIAKSMQIAKQAAGKTD